VELEEGVDGRVPAGNPRSKTGLFFLFHDLSKEINVFLRLVESFRDQLGDFLAVQGVNGQFCFLGLGQEFRIGQSLSVCFDEKLSPYCRNPRRAGCETGNFCRGRDQVDEPIPLRRNNIRGTLRRSGCFLAAICSKILPSPSLTKRSKLL